MAIVTKKRIASQPSFGGVPYGNQTVLEFPLVTNASGVLTDSDQATALAIADKLRLGILPAGFRLMDSLSIVSDAFTALATGTMGFEYVDGVDSADVPQDVDYFSASVAFNAIGRYLSNNLAVRPVTLPKDAYLIVTWAGAANAVVGVADILVRGVHAGPP